MKLSGSLVSGTEVTVAKEREDGEGVNLTPSKLTTSSALEEFQKRKQKKISFKIIVTVKQRSVGIYQQACEHN